MAGNPAELSRAHHGATCDLTNSIKRLENFWRERLNKTESHINWTKTDNKMSIHRTEMYTDYGNIQRKKYNKCGHIHSSAKCCKTKFTQSGQTQNFKLNQMKPLGRIWTDSTHKKSRNEDTFSTPPYTHEKIKKWRNSFWRWKWKRIWIWNMDGIIM